MQATASPQPRTSKVGLLGVGLMGNKMARRLIEEGWQLSAWNRSQEKAQPLEAIGAGVHSTAADVVQSSDVVLLMLADAAAIRSTLLNDTVRPLLQSKYIVQMGTIGPAESRELAAEVTAAGATYIEAPVLGSQPEAEKGTLLVMVGADADPKTTPVWPVLLSLGSSPDHVGPVGTAAATKLALNQLIGSLTVGFSASLGLVQRSGADVDTFMRILRASALYAPTYDKKLSKMLTEDFGTANFPTKHLLKDLRLFRSEAGKAGLDTQLPAALEAVTAAACERGLQDADYSAVYAAMVHPQPAEQQ